MNQNRMRPEDIATMRSSVLGEMRQGAMPMEDRHPFLRKLVRAAVMINLICGVGLWLSFTIKNMFPPHDKPFLWAIGSYFFFGAMYGAFGQMLFSFARYTEQTAIARALTPNRSYAWHGRYDTANIGDEELKKTLPQQPRGQPVKRSSAVGAGRKSFFYASLFALCGIGTCLYGLYTYLSTLFY